MSTRPPRRRPCRLAKLALRALEDRCTPANLVVTSAADNGTGSLRAIIATANTNGEADTITFDPSVTTINLTTGQLTISEKYNLTIDGGISVTINGASAFGSSNRVFGITATNAPTIAMSHLTIANGHINGYGGAILVGIQTLQLSNVSLVYNSSTGYGGAICTSGSSTISMSSCVIEGNSATTEGGGLAVGFLSSDKCHLIVDTCLIRNNASDGFGGGIGFYDSIVTITNSTITGNYAKTNGAGVDIDNSSATILNCTIAQNSAHNSSGGVFVEKVTAPSPTVVIRNCTISNNTAVTNAGGIGVTGMKVQLDSTIIASNSLDNNTTTPSPLTDTNGTNTTLQGNNNLIGIANGSIVAGSNNKYGTQLAPLNAGLLPLGVYGGPLPTMALCYTSVAIDQGSNPFSLQFDQRGQPREVPTGLPDIGAVEGPATDPFVAMVGTLPTVKTAGGIVYSVSVTYDGPNGIDPSSLDGNDIVINGPYPVGPVSFTGSTISGNQTTATYQFAPPGGNWDKFDIGIYSINLLGGQVFGLAPTASSAATRPLGQFTVAVPGLF